MSTTSRNCGTVCSACGSGFDVSSVSGSFSAPREQYDLRAFEPLLWQLGNLWQLQGRRIGLQSFAQMWPKSNLKSKIAAVRSFVSPLYIISPPRGEKLRHSPPLSYLSQPPPILE